VPANFTHKAISVHRRYQNVAGAAALPLHHLRAGLETAQVPGQADAHLGQHRAAISPPTGNCHHIRPQAGICLGEGPLDIEGRRAGVLFRRLIGRGDGNLAVERGDGAEIARGRQAGTGAVLAPFVAGERLGGHHAADSRKIAPLEEGAGIAVGGIVALALRPQAMDEKAQTRAGIALIRLLGCPAGCTEAGRPGQRQHIEIEITRGGYIWNKVRPVDQLNINFDDSAIEIKRSKSGAPTAVVSKIVGGITLKSSKVSMEECIRAVVDRLTKMEAESAATRIALRKFAEGR